MVISKGSAKCQRQTTLDAKLAEFRIGNINTQELKEALDAKQKNACWKRLNTALGHDVDEATMWKSLSGTRQGISIAKHMLLFGWLRDGNFGEHWVSVKYVIGVETKDAMLLKWVAWALQARPSKHGLAEAQCVLQA